MKKLLLLMLLLTFMLLLVSCAQTRREPLSFQTFKLFEQGMSMDKYCYEATKTEQGVVLEYYISRRKPLGQEGEDKEVLRRIAGDETLYQKLCTLLGECGVQQWNGFQGSNPNVVDGTFMRFTAALADGSAIEASGHNRFPKGYEDFCKGLKELLKEDSGS